MARRYECEVVLEIAGLEDRFAVIPLTLHDGFAPVPMPQTIQDSIKRLWEEAASKGCECELSVRIRPL